jgi:hypothetical protein
MLGHEILLFGLGWVGFVSKCFALVPTTGHGAQDLEKLAWRLLFLCFPWDGSDILIKRQGVPCVRKQHRLLRMLEGV